MSISFVDLCCLVSVPHFSCHLNYNNSQPLSYGYWSNETNFQTHLSKILDLWFCTCIFNIPLSFATYIVCSWPSSRRFSLITFRGGHRGLRYCGIGLFFMRYFGNLDFNVRYRPWQTREKSRCLYENLMSDNFRKMAVLKKSINCKLKLQSKGLS